VDAETEIIPLTAHEIPTVLSFDRTSNEYVIGTAARALGIKGQTNIFNFKPDLGISPARFDKDKKYWVRVDETGTRAPTNAFTPREVSKRFLELLLAGVSKRPECLIIGEPAIRDKTWREHFRQHMRAILTNLGIPEPQFFPEPFAVFQYFRHIAHVLPKVDSPQTILVIDIGGGTFDTCIIRTTQSGNLARGGATAIPLGIQSVATAGRDIDRALLDTLIKGARNSGIRFKDDPIKRAESVSIPVLFFVENAKIKLSEKIHGGGFEENYGHISETVVVPAKVLHPDCEIRVDLTGEDLKRAISSVWHRSLGDTMLACVKEAGISRIDKVLIAGGSARLPFLSELVYKTLKTLVRKEDIVVGECAGEAVAYGIGVECREQLQRNPKLATDRIAPCVLNDLYLSFSQSRYEPARPANSVRPRRTNGQLLLAPLQTDTLETNYVFELPFSPKKQLFYWFTGQPVNMSSMGERLNVAHDVLRVPPRASRRLRLQLSFKENGEIIPTVEFQVIDSNGRHA